MNRPSGRLSFTYILGLAVTLAGLAGYGARPIVAQQASQIRRTPTMLFAATMNSRPRRRSRRTLICSGQTNAAATTRRSTPSHGGPMIQALPYPTCARWACN